MTDLADKAADTDLAVTHQAAQHRHDPLVKAAGAAAEIADQPPLIALSAGTALVGLVTRRPDLVRGGLRMLAAHGVATGIKTLIKHRVDRTRPKKALDDGEHRFELGRTHDHDLNSFPSGHLAGAVAVSRAAAHEIDGASTPAALVTAAVAAAQAPAGNHYLSDMVAGTVIGWLSEAAVGALFDAADPLIDRALARLAPAA
jgi:membrane-associated phospholipid phosphatase